MGMNEYTDTELFVLLKKDDEKAFYQIYLKYHSPLYKNIFKLLKDGNQAENILQEVFITLWEKRNILDPNHLVLSNWLFTVSYNKSLTFLKKSLREANCFKEFEIASQNNDDDELTLKEAQLKILDAALSRLSPQQKKVFELCKLNGKSYLEAAQELNISKHTVKEYLSIAVGSVKAYVKEHPYAHIALICLLKSLGH
jgi:RNA polymerase sigma factor (sigma-70 family)